MDINQIDRELLGILWTSSDLWDNLAYLCDECNGRFAGSDDERKAGAFIAGRFRQYGLENIAAETFGMRGWERGEAQLTILAGGREIHMPCLALPGTPGCALEADVIDVKQGTAADFAALGDKVAGKVVLASADGPSRQEKYASAFSAGAAGFIFGGLQPGMLPPIGGAEKDLPAIGLAHEHTARIRRMLAAGPVRARLQLSARVMAVTARNIVAELPGTDPSQGWIVAGGHYDGHDIAQGAQDNGAGTAILMEAARLLAPYRAQLKMGIRFVLFSGEELGLNGSYAYAQQHAAEMDQVRLMFNADVVAIGMPLVLSTQASPELAGYLRTLPLKELDAIVNDGPGNLASNSDHFPFVLAGVPSVWAVTSAAPAPGPGWIHTSADTLDKVDLRILRQTAGAAARVLLRMASDPDSLPRGHRPASEVQKVVTDAGFEKSLRANGRWPF